MSESKQLSVIGELINNSFARARRAWETKDLKAYQHLAKLQADLGASYLNINIDGTQAVTVKMNEMLEFLPELIPAIQEVTSLPLSFDNPALQFHEVALKHYDFKSGRPIMNSIAASRENLDAMIELIVSYDTRVVVMSSEKFSDDGTAQCLNAEDAYQSAQHFVSLLNHKANRTNNQIIIDPGLAPVGADTYGLVNIGLDAMKKIAADNSFKGVHFSVGLTNFAWGTPKEIRNKLEYAYLSLATEVGLDYVLANPEKKPHPLPSDDPTVTGLREALEQGRPVDGESQEEAGFRQAEAIMNLWMTEDHE